MQRIFAHTHTITVIQQENVIQQIIAQTITMQNNKHDNIRTQISDIHHVTQNVKGHNSAIR